MGRRWACRRIEWGAWSCLTRITASRLAFTSAASLSERLVLVLLCSTKITIATSRTTAITPASTNRCQTGSLRYAPGARGRRGLRRGWGVGGVSVWEAVGGDGDCSAIDREATPSALAAPHYRALRRARPQGAGAQAHDPGERNQHSTRRERDQRSIVGLLLRDRGGGYRAQVEGMSSSRGQPLHSRDGCGPEPRSGELRDRRTAARTAGHLGRAAGWCSSSCWPLRCGRSGVAAGQPRVVRLVAGDLPPREQRGDAPGDGPLGGRLSSW